MCTYLTEELILYQVREFSVLIVVCFPICSFPPWVPKYLLAVKCPLFSCSGTPEVNNQQWGTDFWMCKTSFVVLWDKPGSVILAEGNVPLEYGYSQAVTLANSRSQPRGKMYSWKLLPLACTPEQIEKQIMPLWDLRFVQSRHESRAIHLHWP